MLSLLMAGLLIGTLMHLLNHLSVTDTGLNDLVHENLCSFVQMSMEVADLPVVHEAKGTRTR